MQNWKLGGGRNECEFFPFIPQVAAAKLLTNCSRIFLSVRHFSRQEGKVSKSLTKSLTIRAKLCHSIQLGWGILKIQIVVGDGLVMRIDCRSWLGRIAGVGIWRFWLMFSVFILNSLCYGKAAFVSVKCYSSLSETCTILSFCKKLDQLSERLFVWSITVYVTT